MFFRRVAATREAVRAKRAFDRGDWQACADHARVAVAAWTEMGDLRWPQGFWSVALLSASLDRLSQPAEAEVVRASAIEALWPLPINEARQDLPAIRRFRDALTDTDQVPAALDVSRFVEHVERELNGADSIDWANEADVTAYLLGTAGRNDEAAALLDRILPITERATGSDSKETYRVLKRAGVIAYARECDEAARLALERALDLRERFAYQDDHPQWWLSKLALALARMDKHEEAVKIFPLALPRLKEEPDVLMYLVPLSWYALSLGVLERYDEAIELELENIQGWRAIGWEDQAEFGVTALAEFERRSKESEQDT
jgi:tetratricopeptide (TPR) repeat protein